MYIAPNSKVYLLRGVPLNKKYEHSVAYKTPEEQLDGFLQFPHTTSLALQYVRQTKSIKLPISADDIYGCNYMVYQNTPYTNKYYYAFIDRIAYISNETCEIFFTIDVLQSYWFDFEFLPCYVEREHSLHDDFGYNKIAEPFNAPAYYHKKLTITDAPFNKADCSVVIAYGTEKDGVDKKVVVDNVFSGIDYQIFANPNEAYAVLQAINAAGHASQVVGVYQVPTKFFANYETVDFHDSTPRTLDIGGEDLHDLLWRDFDGYTPKNKKLYTQQFYGIYCESSSGDSKTFALEDFGNPYNPTFHIKFSLAGSPTCELNPVNYAGVNGENRLNSLLCTDFPLCSWVNDSYAEYLALNKGKLRAQQIGIGLSAIGTVATGIGAIALAPATAAGSLKAGLDTTGSILSTGRSLANYIGNLRDAKVAPDKVHADASFGFNYTIGCAGYTFYVYYPRRDYAEMLDNLFTMFGYQTNEIKIPGIYNRPTFNYIKTKGCLIKPKNNNGLPTDYIDTICTLFDNGITLWSALYDVGDYGKPNDPT